MSKRQVVIATVGIGIGLAAAGQFAVWSFPLQSPGKVYKVSDGITPPKVIQKVDPDYTDAALAAKIKGTVALTVVVSVEGVATDIKVTKSLGSCFS